MVSSVNPQSAVSSRVSTHASQSHPTPPIPSPTSHRRSRDVKSSKAAGAQNSTVRLSMPIIAIAIALGILAPVLTFLVVPEVLGRVIVTLLVALSVVGGLLQSRVVNTAVLLSRESGACAAVYGAVMLVIAGVIA
jgi:hypothetical protein